MCVQSQFYRLSKGLCCLILLVIIGCEEKPPDTTISQFDRPQDVALVCHDPQQLTDKTPLTCCGIKTYPVDPSDPCADSKSSTATLYAFVTQTTPGEVAVVDVNRNQIVDQDGRIPYNSFIPVGGQPSDIVASSDGKRVFTVNYETGDLSIINTADALKKNPVVTAASTIELGAPAGRVALNTTPLKDRDNYAFITLPSTNRLAVVALNEEASAAETTDPDGGMNTRENCANGCLLGYLEFDSVVTSGLCQSDIGDGTP